MAKEMDLVEAIKTATPEQLASVRARMAELTREIEALRAVERVLSLRIEGKPERRPREPRESGAKLADRIYECITVNGPGKVEDIARKIGEKEQAVRMSIQRSDWFKVLDSGKVMIATTGDR